MTSTSSERTSGVIRHLQVRSVLMHYSNVVAVSHSHSTKYRIVDISDVVHDVYSVAVEVVSNQSASIQF